MDYYITYRNQGKSERTPIMPDAEANALKNISLLKIQGATCIKVHKIERNNNV
jgi:hypothetical protein